MLVVGKDCVGVMFEVIDDCLISLIVVVFY